MLQVESKDQKILDRKINSIESCYLLTVLHEYPINAILHTYKICPTTSDYGSLNKGYIIVLAQQSQLLYLHGDIYTCFKQTLDIRENNGPVGLLILRHRAAHRKGANSH